MAWRLARCCQVVITITNKQNAPSGNTVYRVRGAGSGHSLCIVNQLRTKYFVDYKTRNLYFRLNKMLEGYLEGHTSVVE